MTPAKKTVPGASPASSPEPRLWGIVPPQPISIADPAVELEEIMTVRTTKRTVSFARPFVLDDFSEQFPPGRYAIETDEDLLDGMLFPAYLRGVTVMQLITDRRPGITEPAVIDPFQLDAALALDAVLASMTEAGETRTPIAPAAHLVHTGEVVSLDVIGSKP